MQNERSKIHHEAMRLNQERELLELEKENFIQAQVNKEMKRIRELKRNQCRSKETLQKNNDKTDDEKSDSDSSIESVEGEGQKKVRKIPELTNAAKKIATRTLRNWALKFEGDTEKAADFLDKLTDCQESSGLTFQQIN